MNRIEAVSPAAPSFDRRVDDAAAPAEGDSVAVAAVLAHTLLNSIAVVRGGTELLARHHDALPPEERRAWYQRIDDHAEHLAIVLERVAQGRLAEALAESERGCGADRPSKATPTATSLAARRARSTLRRA